MSWIQKRRTETYYRKAKKEGFRSRAIYKLEQMDEKFSLIKDGMNILDLGASPGGWSQYISSVNKNGINVAVDLQAMRKVEGVIFVKDDLFAPDLESRIAIYSPDGFDLILSDILMHTSGDKSRDQANSFFICKRVLEICNVLLRRNGRVVAKTIQGDLTDELETEYRKYFRRVYLTKPPSSLPSSPEVYILGEGYSGH